jgi:hypothetical protein
MSDLYDPHDKTAHVNQYGKSHTSRRITEHAHAALHPRPCGELCSCPAVADHAHVGSGRVVIADRTDVVVLNGATPGSFAVRTGAASVELSTHVDVEREVDGGFVLARKRSSV